MLSTCLLLQRGVQVQKNLASLPGLQDKLLQGVKVADMGCG